MSRCKFCGRGIRNRNKRGWKIEPTFNLPDGFELREEDHFLYLYKGDAFIASFSAVGATPKNILAVCKEARE